MTPEQDIELQMCRGKYKELRCRNVGTTQGCNKGRLGPCPFLHPEDIGREEEIAERTAAVRQRVFRAMDRDKYALPPPIRLEIGEITPEEYDEMMRRQYEHDHLVEDNE